ncbi:S26 family signal peptidase [Micromonospora sp. CA-246542]|uniref:S26 family signal peptidase n=1 Tax=Micromonospora sp. CA-246542 TaxID=3239959 RepID=UPI003D89F182
MSAAIWGSFGLVTAMVGLLGAAVVSGRLFGVVVTGRSMEPTLRSGQTVFVLRRRPDRVRRGDVVLLVDPAIPDAYVIKRVVALAGDAAPIPAGPVPAGSPVPEEEVLLLGDNPVHSVDSRLLGGYERRHILGVALLPRPRARRRGSPRRR